MTSPQASHPPAVAETSPLARLRKEHIATRCVCCASETLESSPAILMPFLADRIFGWKPTLIDESWGLRTIPAGMAYSLCNTRRCRDCGHMFCDLRFSDGEMGNLYGGYRGEDYTRLRDFYEPGYAARNVALIEQVTYLESIEAFIEPHLDRPFTLLDWGGDTGKNTPFRGKAAKIDVYDISDMPVIEGLNVVDRDGALSQKYKLIICSMVLEHVPYPSDVLFDIGRAMDERSLLYVEVPFEEVMRRPGPLSSTMKRHWHEHVNFYSRESMTRLLENCGFEVVDMAVLEALVAGSDLHVLQVASRLKRR